MPWVLANSGTSSPGIAVQNGGVVFERQSFMLDFPDFAEGTVRRFGTLWWRARNAAPANAIAAQRQSWVIWHNSTQVYVEPLGTGGSLFFQTFERFGGPLSYRIWRFDP